MTNQQSNEDGSATADEIRWLAFRGAGGFGHVNTCCSHVVEEGKGFPGELGIFSDELLPGLQQLTRALRAEGAVSNAQLYHGGARAIAQRVGPVEDAQASVRALSTDEVDRMVAAFAAAARRAEIAGFDGVQIHAAHGYLVSHFLSKDLNRRTDEYGGSPQGRSRFLVRIVEEVRRSCSPTFQVGVRVSPERFGQDLFETLETAQQLIDSGQIDYLDFSLWDVAKMPEDPRAGAKSLLDWCLSVDRSDCRVGVAGKIIRPEDALRCIESGADYVALGKVAILNHDYPRRLQADPEFQPVWRPITAAELSQQGLGKKFIDYLATYTHPVFAELDPEIDPSERFDIDSYVSGQH